MIMMKIIVEICIILALTMMWGSSGFSSAGGFNPFQRTKKPKLKNYTAHFLEMCKNLYKQPSIIFMNLGGRGSGKTAQMFKLFTIIMNSFEEGECGVVFMKAPDSFMVKLKNKAPSEIFSCFYNIDRIRELTEIKKNTRH